MNKKQIILIGGGGHCKSCIDVIESSSEYEIAGIIDVKEKIGSSILGYEIIGCDHNLKELRQKYKYALVTVGQIKSVVTRVKLFNLLKKLDYTMPVIIASTAYVSQHASIGEGSIIMHHVMINASVKIGRNCIVNTKSLIEHECQVSNHCHLSTNSLLNGNVSISEGCFIGSSAVVANDVSISKNVIVGMGALILNSIDKPGVYLGVF